MQGLNLVYIECFLLYSFTMFPYSSQSSDIGNRKYNLPNQNRFWSKGDIYRISKTFINTKGFIYSKVWVLFKEKGILMRSPYFY